MLQPVRERSVRGRRAPIRGGPALLLALCLAMTAPGMAGAQTAQPGGQPGSDARAADGPAGDRRVQEAKAQARDRAARQLLDAAREGGASSSGSQSAAAADRYPDPESDTVRVTVNPDGSTEQAPEALPPADLTSYSVDYGATELSFSAEVSEPLDPRTDQSWFEGRNSISWLVMGPDGEPSGIASFTAIAGELYAFHLALVGDDVEDVVVCDALATFDGVTYGAERIPAGCAMGSPISTAASTTFFVGDAMSVDAIVDTAPDQAPDGETLVTNGPLSQELSDTSPERNRIAGSNRIETAIAVSQERFAPPGTATVAYLARADEFPDALAAGVLDNGPTLLVPRCGELPDGVAEELGRLGPLPVVALGGQDAVCDDLLAQAALAAGGVTEPLRLGGSNRFQTAAAISQAAFPVSLAGFGAVYLADAGDFPDALSTGSLTRGLFRFDTGPVLLVPECGTLPDPIRAEIERLAPGDVVALGGPAAVCDELVVEATRVAQAAVDEQTPPEQPESFTVTVSAQRVAGATRLGTAVAFSQYRFPLGAPEVYLATSGDFADALAGGSLLLGPILLVPSCGDLPDFVSAEIDRLNPTRVSALGGPVAICEEVLDQAVEAM